VTLLVEMYVVPEDVQISDVIGPRAAMRLYKRALSKKQRHSPTPDVVLDRESGSIVFCTDRQRPKTYQSLLTDDTRPQIIETFRSIPMTLWTRTQPAKRFGRHIQRLQRPPEARNKDNDDDVRQEQKFIPVISMVPLNTVFKGTRTRKR